MEWVETTGKTLDDAKDRALAELGVDETEAEIEVLEEPRMGLFGKVRAEARVRARVRPSTPRAREDRRDKKRRGRDSRAKKGPVVEESPAPLAAEATEVPLPVQESAPRAPKRAPKGQGGGRHQQEETVMEQNHEDEVSLEEQGDVASDFLDGVLDCLDLDAEIVITELEGDLIEVALAGEGLGMLVGPRGTTLSALQELTRTAVLRKTGTRRCRVVIDVAGYRSKRRTALEGFARRTAEDVLASGEMRVLEAMAAADRKVIHDTVNEIPGVTTRSEGEEPKRRVVLLPDPAE